MCTHIPLAKAGHVAHLPMGQGIFPVYLEVLAKGMDEYLPLVGKHTDSWEL